MAALPRKKLIELILRMMGRNDATVKAGISKLIKDKNATQTQLVEALMSRSSGGTTKQRLKFLDIISSKGVNKVAKEAKHGKFDQSRVASIRTFLQDPGRAEEIGQPVSKFLGAADIPQAAAVAAPIPRKGNTDARKRTARRLLGERSQRQKRTKDRQRIAAKVGTGRIISGRRAAKQAQKAVAEESGRTRFGKAALATGAGGGFLLSRMISGGSSGSPMQTQARQKILEAIMGQDRKADRQPLIDAQTELSKVRTMILLQKLMAQQEASVASIPFS